MGERVARSLPTMSDPVAQTRLLLHVGYHKTGSSWLQRELFGMRRAWDSGSAHPRMRQPGAFVAPWSQSDMTRQLVWDHPLSFDPERAREFFSAGIEQAIRASRIPVISHERLSGLPQIGGCDSKEMADRLVSVFPSARILIVIREQASMLVSLWKGYVQRGGIRSLERFVAQQASPGNLGYLGRHLEYHHMIAYYQRLFGEESVLVLPFEFLAREPASFVAKLAGFSESPPPSNIDYSRENRSLSSVAVAIKRFLNLTVLPVDIDVLPQPRINASLLSLIKVVDQALPSSLSGDREHRRNADLREALGRTYAESNQITCKLLGTDLAEYDYEC